MTLPFAHDVIRPLHVVIIGLVVMTVAGGMLLLSAAQPTAPVDGAIEWHEGSLLRAVVEVLCLSYRFPADYASAVKSFILGIGSGLALIAVGIAVGKRARTSEEGLTVLGVGALPGGLDVAPSSPAHGVHIAPLVAAQVLVGLYLLWSFASSRWSQAADLAVGGSILLSIHFCWAICVGNGLSPTAARIAARTTAAILIVTATIAIWYHYGRNPTLRADFPVGNPVFLGACLIPGLLLTAAIALERVTIARTERSARGMLIAVSVCAVAIGVIFWALLLADSRGPYVGLVFGVLAMWHFAARGRVKWVPVAMSLGCIVVGWLYLIGYADSFSSTGRSATLRLRTHAWSFGWQMFSERPLQGHGQGGFVLAGDSYAVNEVLLDPQVFESRIAHAHNEWIEVMADLGSVGLVLIAGVILLTLHAGMVTLSARPPPGIRWILIGCMASLVGLVVEEFFSVGLRVPGVATMFYTILGLIWALSSYGMRGLVHRLSAGRAGRSFTCAIACAAGLFVLAMTQQDFASARHVHQAKEALRQGDYAQAMESADRAAGARLNPQRGLTNYYRQSETHVLIAEKLQHKARDRARRAYESAPPNARLIALANEDLRESDRHCEAASAALKNLVMRSPGFMNHGRLGYRLNLIRAAHATANNDTKQERALLEDAATWIKQELDRQPFDPSIAVDFVRVAYPKAEAGAVIEVLARPLRHHRITNDYMDLLQGLSQVQAFDAALLGASQESPGENVAPTRVDSSSPAPLETWLPEKLRLAATVGFMRGEYERSVQMLQRAAGMYDKLAPSGALGAASCYEELAICQFFLAPANSALPLLSAASALRLAPQSRLGRELCESVMQRMIEFHLAAGQEDEATALLRQAAPRGVTDTDVVREMGLRYARMCESMLRRREAGGTLRKAPADLAPLFQRWIGRALELNQGDASLHYLAADLAQYTGDDTASAGYLRSALDLGLPLDYAREFLRLAKDQRPLGHALEMLWSAIMPVDAPSDGANAPSTEMP